MKNVVIAAGILFALQCFADITCIKVSGSFEASIDVWKSRWQQYNGSTFEPSSNQVKEVWGYYREGEKINGFRSWSQIGGVNAIWFGDRCSPYDSFDVWYVGDPNCVAVPAVRKSIPRIPTFIPNILAYGGRNFNLLDRPITSGFPKIESVTITEEEYTNLVKSINAVSLEEPLFIETIDVIAGDVNLWWRGKDTNCTYMVMRSFDLINWEECSFEIKSANRSDQVNHYSEIRDGLNIVPTGLAAKMNQAVFFKVVKKRY